MNQITREYWDINFRIATVVWSAAADKALLKQLNLTFAKLLNCNLIADALFEITRRWFALKSSLLLQIWSPFHLPGAIMY